jgi:hypothetical protein
MGSNMWSPARLLATCVAGSCLSVVPIRAQGQPLAQAGDGSQALAGGITSMTLERDCSGCATGVVLVLRRDGTASLTVTGKARLGTETKVAIGSLRLQAFDALARLAVEQGFFHFNDNYEQPDVMDGGWTTLTIVLGSRTKSVFMREEAGPPGLKAIQAAIDAVRAGIDFVPPR